MLVPNLALQEVLVEEDDVPLPSLGLQTQTTQSSLQSSGPQENALCKMKFFCITLTRNFFLSCLTAEAYKQNRLLLTGSGTIQSNMDVSDESSEDSLEKVFKAAHSQPSSEPLDVKSKDEPKSAATSSLSISPRSPPPITPRTPRNISQKSKPSNNLLASLSSKNSKIFYTILFVLLT